MQNQLQKINKFSLFYIILACADFLYSTFNFVRISLSYGFTVSELFSWLGRTVLFILPFIALVFISKKAVELEDAQKRLKIKKYMTIYLIASFVSGIVHFLLANLLNCYIPIFPFCLFYTYSWVELLSMIIQHHFYKLLFSLFLDITFWVITIMFIKSLNRKKTPEEEFNEGAGKTSTGYKLGIASLIFLTVQSVLNVILAVIMHENLSGVSGEQAIGAAFVAIILIIFKVFMNLILFPAIPLSIIGIVKCSSKKEKDQDRKYRRLGKKISIICLVIAVAELVFIW